MACISHVDEVSHPPAEPPPDWVMHLRVDHRAGASYTVLAERFGLCDPGHARKVALGIYYPDAA